MDVIVAHSAALDLHKEQVSACVRVPGPDGTRREEVRRFSTTVRGPLTLHDWFEAHGVTQVAMLLRTRIHANLSKRQQRSVREAKDTRDEL
jgi:hypothetical protein